MSNLQIKNVPDELHDELRRRADRAGVPLRDYVLRVLERELVVPADWRERLASLPAVEDHLDVPGLIRRERDARTDRILGALAAEDDAAYE